MLTVLVLSSVIALAYLGISVKACGCIPESLSATYYALGSGRWLFPAAMGVTALTLYPAWISVSHGNTEGFAFGACASLLFVAASPCFREELEGKVHYTSAVVCCVCAVLWQVWEGLWDVTLWCGVVGLMLTLQDRSRWCWWMECTVLASVYINLFRLV